MKYVFIESQRTQHRIARLCRVLRVSTSGFYEWASREPSATTIANETLSEEIVRIHEQSRQTYGRPRIHAELKACGLSVSQKRVGRLMRSANIAGKTPRRFRKTTDSNHAFPTAPNILDRKFDVADIGCPNLVWAGDITYLSTREGWLYLAVILDLYSRRVVGWSMKSSMRRDLVTDAFKAAVGMRVPAAGTLFHTDRGSQYASTEAREQLEKHGFVMSMSGKGECWDNAVVESFFGSMKSELGDVVWETKAAARAAVFDYIEIWYNLRRRHSTLGYLSPEEFESS